MGASARRAWFATVAAIILAAALYILVTLVQGGEIGDARDDLPLMVLAVAGLLALIGWQRERAAVSATAEEEREARERLEAEVKERAAEVKAREAEVREREAETRAAREELESEREQHQTALREAREELESEREQHQTALRETREALESDLRDRDEALRQEKGVRAQLERAREAEREWARELRGQISQLYRERGTLGDTSDVREMVLHVAVTLTGAEKGLLLARPDGAERPDGGAATPSGGALDGQHTAGGPAGAEAPEGLELVAAEGFENDPADSRVARRFATEVIEHDTTVREDDVTADGDATTPADDELHNLAAIPIYITDELSGVVVCANNPDGFDDHDDEVLLSLGDHAGAVLENARLQGDLRSSYIATVRMLAEAIEVKDPSLRWHSDEVSSYVGGVADRLGLDPSRREELLFGSLLHDVGKIGISERILLKPDVLTPEERSVVELHPRLGYRLVEQVPALRPIALAILHHHEHFDGGGYPAGLRGEEVPIEARIIGVVDSFSAMTTDRPYRARMSVEEACVELERCAGTQFDPEVVRAFVEEVRHRPPSSEEQHALANALGDPELELRRSADEPVLGYGPIAATDNLTLLYSHRYFHEVARAEGQRAAVQNRPFAVVLAELTGIEEVNREQGYAAGDAAIQTAARAVQAAATRCGGTAARYGGRRLGLIAPGADQHAAERLVEELAAGADGGPGLRAASASWQSGESGDDVIARARRRLAVTPEPSR